MANTNSRGYLLTWAAKRDWAELRTRDFSIPSGEKSWRKWAKNATDREVEAVGVIAHRYTER